MFEVIKPYLGEMFAAVIGGVIGYLPNRKKSRIDNQQAIVDLYQESLTDLKERYEEKYQDLKATFDAKLVKVVTELETLKKSLNDWRKKYFTLKKDFDQYKKDHP